jgi:hypothetical protein
MTARKEAVEFNEMIQAGTLSQHSSMKLICQPRTPKSAAERRSRSSRTRSSAAVDEPARLVQADANRPQGLRPSRAAWASPKSELCAAQVPYSCQPAYIVTQASNSPRPNLSNNANGSRKANDLRPGRPQQQPRPLTQQRTVSTPHLAQRNQALASLIKGGESAPQRIRNQANFKANGAGISIKGMSSNYTVIAQNFAPGTTAADIEAVLVPDETNAGLVRCRLVASNPTVIAEVVMTNREVAEDIIATYNNKKVRLMPLTPGILR